MEKFGHLRADLRRKLDSERLVVAPGCFDALSAKIIEKAGWQAVFMSGSGTAQSFGLQDVGFMTLTEVVGNVKQIADRVNIPLVADADTGFGNAIHVTRSVKEFVQAGAAGMLIEDQVFYKRCGHLAGKMLISFEEAVGKFRAASDTRDEYDENFLIIARTDARGAVGGGLDEAIKRGNAYAEAGADMVFVEAPKSEQEIERCVKEINAPILYNWTHLDPSAKPSFERMQEMGIGMVTFPGLATRAAHRSIYDLATALKVKGTRALEDFENEMKGHPMEDSHAFAGIPAIVKLEEKYLPPEEVKTRYEKSLTGADYRKKS